MRLWSALLAVALLAALPVALAWGAPPANDNFGSATVVNPAGERIVGTLAEASFETGEPATTTGDSRTVWYA